MAKCFYFRTFNFKWNLLISLAFIAFFEPVYAQTTTFNRGFVFLDSLVYESIEQVIEIEDGYLISGFSHLTKPKLVISKLNFSGEKLWQKQYGDGRINFRPGFYDSMIRTSDSNFALAITYNDTLNEPENRIMIMKFDPNGDTLWSRLAYSPDSVNEYCSAFGILETYDRGFLVYGREGGLTGVLIKTDSLGNKEWKTEYGYHMITNCRGIFCVRQTSDSGYIAGGWQQDLSDVKSGDPRIVRFKKDGARTWDRYIGGQFEDYPGTFLQPSGDGNFIAITHYTTETSGYPYYVPEKSMLHIIKISEDNEVLFDAMIGDDGKYLYVEDLEVMNDGSFIACGRDIWDGISWMYNFALAKDSLFFRMLNPPCRNDTLRTLSDIKPTSDGGIIACGFFERQYNNEDENHPWIIKTDRFACLDIGCDTNGIYLIQQPVPVTTCKNIHTSINLTTYNSGDNVLYNWQHFFNGAWQNIEDEIVYQGFDDDTLLINSSQITNQQESYRCNFFNEYWSFYSDSVVVNFLDTLVIVSQPQSQSVHYGEPANFQIIPTGKVPIDYQWYHNDQVIDGSIDSVLFIQKVTENDTGTYYCALSNECGEVLSDRVILQISNLGIDDKKDQICLMISPNPTNGMLNLYYSKKASLEALKIADLSGKPILEVILEKAGNGYFQLDLSALSQGFYFLVIQTENERIVKKILKI